MQNYAKHACMIMIDHLCMTPVLKSKLSGSAPHPSLADASAGEIVQASAPRQL